MPVLKAVIDTSVMVSVAFAKQGLAKELKDMIADEAFMLVTSKQILKELHQVLNYPRIIKRFTPSQDDINEFIGLIMERGSKQKIAWVLMDPEGNGIGFLDIQNIF